MNTPLTEEIPRTLNEADHDFGHGSEVPGAGRAVMIPLNFRDEEHEGRGDTPPHIEEISAWIDPMDKRGAPAQDLPVEGDRKER